jgi:RNA polymerase sigma-70 factor (ECF subfamily)
MSSDGTLPMTDGDSVTTTNDMATLTRKLIAELPDKQRLAIHMRDIEGYEIEEIANLLESDEASVRVNLSRARKSIREQLIKLMNYGVK